jgi:hypothetical protein
MNQNEGLKMIAKRDLFEFLREEGIVISYSTFWRKVKRVFENRNWVLKKNRFFSAEQHKAILEEME